MNRLGMMVDVSHPSKASMMQAAALSKAPIIASHSAVRALADHRRNMDDEQLLALKKNGGVVQVVAFAGYVKVSPDPAEVEAARGTGAGRCRCKWCEPVATEATALPDRGRRRNAGAGQSGPRDGEGFRRPHRLRREAHRDRSRRHLVRLRWRGGITGWNSAAETFNVTLELVRRGYSEKEIGKLWSGNLLRVWREVEKVARTLQSEGK